MNWKGFGRKWVWPISSYCPSIHLEVQKETTKTQNNWSPSQDMNLGPTEHEAGVLTTRPRHLVSRASNDVKMYTMKPLSIVSEGTAENKKWMSDNNSCGKAF
jgi:hypothetical protein